MPIVPFCDSTKTVKKKLLLLSALLCVDLILEGLASLECRNCRSSDLDCSACSRVTAAASSELLCLECTETNKNNLVALCKSTLDCIESSLEGSLCVLLGKTRLSSDCVDKL